MANKLGSNLTNKYNPQEQYYAKLFKNWSSNLTNKYNPQEQLWMKCLAMTVQILPINTILKNGNHPTWCIRWVQILPINTILKNGKLYLAMLLQFKSYQ